MRRTTLISALSLAAAGLVLSGGAFADGNHGRNSQRIKVDLSGFEEVPVVVTNGKGSLRLNINRAARTIDYVLTYSDLQGDITQAHIHVAQKDVNGAIVLWLCQTAANPAPTTPAAVAATPVCPAGKEGTVEGQLTDASALASTGNNAGQQLAAGSLDDALIAIAAGKAYGNVHTTLSPGGEVRGQLRHDH